MNNPANIYSFHDYAYEKHSTGGLSDDRMVRIDMMEMGLNPSDPKDIEEYWHFMTENAQYEVFLEEEEPIKEEDEE